MFGGFFLGGGRRRGEGERAAGVSVHVTVVNLGNRTREVRRRQTLCDKRDNNFVLKYLFAKLRLPLN